MEVTRPEYAVGSPVGKICVGPTNVHCPKSAAAACGFVVVWRPAKLVGPDRQTKSPTKTDTANHLQTRAYRRNFIVFS